MNLSWTYILHFKFSPILLTRLILLKPVASILGIRPENIFANQLLFGNSGEFRGFDANEPTSRSGGKATAVEQIKKVNIIAVPSNTCEVSEVH